MGAGRGLGWRCGGFCRGNPRCPCRPLHLICLAAAPAAGPSSRWNRSWLIRTGSVRRWNRPSGPRGRQSGSLQAEGAGSPPLRDDPHRASTSATAAMALAPAALADGRIPTRSSTALPPPRRLRAQRRSCATATRRLQQITPQRGRGGRAAILRQRRLPAVPCWQRLVLHRLRQRRHRSRGPS